MLSQILLRTQEYYILWFLYSSGGGHCAILTGSVVELAGKQYEEEGYDEQEVFKVHGGRRGRLDGLPPESGIRRGHFRLGHRRQPRQRARPIELG